MFGYWITPYIIKAPIFIVKIRFLFLGQYYLRVRHLIKNGEKKAPNAPPKGKMPIKRPLIVDFCV